MKCGIQNRANLLAGVVAVSGALGFTGCAPPDSSLRKYDDTYIEGTEIFYIGDLDENRLERLFEIYDRATEKPSILNITSKGGSVELGLDFGEWVYKNKLDVRIPSLCVSSCANYVFTAAATVFLHSDALIYWHGSPIYDDLVEGTIREQSRWHKVRRLLVKNGFDGNDPEKYWRKIRKRNRDYFKTVGVSPVITVALNVADPRSGRSRGSAYYLSVDDMAMFGRHHVLIEKGDVWDPTRSEHYRAGIRQIDLARDANARISALHRTINKRQSSG